MKLFIDIDGVIRNLVSGIYRYNHTIYSPLDDEFIDTWDAELFEKSVFDWVKVPEVISLSLPYPYSLSLLRGLKNHELYFLSVQPKEIYPVTIDWLKKWKFLSLVQGIVFVESIESKVLFTSGLGAHLIDDHPELWKYLSFPQFLPISRPWNEYRKFRDYWEIVEFLNGGEKQWKW